MPIKLNINRMWALPKRNFILGGIVVIVRRPSINRVGFDNYVKLIPPQRHINEGAKIKGIGREWFTPYTGRR